MNKIAKELVKLAKELVAYGYVRRVDLKMSRSGSATKVDVFFEDSNPWNVKYVRVEVSAKGNVKVNGKRARTTLPTRYQGTFGQMRDMAIQNWLSQEETWDEIGPQVFSK